MQQVVRRVWNDEKVEAVLAGVLAIHAEHVVVESLMSVVWDVPAVSGAPPPGGDVGIHD